MASSENLASLEPWNMMFKPAFPDLWFSEADARDTETLTKALQKTLFSNIDETSTDTNTNDNSTNSFSMNETFSSDSFNPFTSLIETASPNSDGLERFWVRAQKRLESPNARETRCRVLLGRFRNGRHELPNGLRQRL
ncbi:hypothetical protein OIU84_011691 [Salix udensis]|uniref:Uncharacterized protein n=1 Tax=Salix udensis TaxID=889485 RepID=A0AAD6JNH0_9ROSI|nr:hypothetical protein OIU84_011691 [Salix udensis]